MSDYWIRDAELRVLGPVSLAVLRDLLAARRLVGVEHVSRDGVSWVPAEQFPELALEAPTPRDATARQREEAAELRAQLTRLGERPLHEVFRVPAEAPAATYRASYFALVRRYHPSRLAPDAPPELTAAYQEAFRFYSDRLAQVEERLMPRQLMAAPAAAVRTREYRAEEFVGIERRGEDRIHASVRVTLANYRMFTDHSLVNISTGGMFLATQVPIALGTQVDVEMTFAGTEPRRVRARARVVWESTGADPRFPRGVGLKFLQLQDVDRTFIQEFVRDAATART